MLDNLMFIFSPALLIIMLSIFVSWLCLKTICIARPDFIKFLYISSGKSTTNARLLGGLSISSSLIIAISSLLYFFPENLNISETRIFHIALFSIVVVSLYGYIDDKFEVRVRFKLSLQLISVLSFAFFNAKNISPEHQTAAFVISSIFGLAMVNGTNLLDGLDTLSVKLGTVSSIAFLYLGITTNSPATIFLSLTLISSLGVFYFFNKEPAKVYMGEIGGSILGLIYFIQSSICFSNLQTKMSSANALSLVLLAAFYPICELGISFIRRIIFKKTPFRGDKLHLHYVMKNKYKLTASTVSNRIGLSGLLILTFGYIIAFSYGPILALLAVTLITLQCYLWVCLEEWKSSYLNEDLENVFKFFEGKTVNIIDSTQFSTLDVILDEDKVPKDAKKKSA